MRWWGLMQMKRLRDTSIKIWAKAETQQAAGTLRERVFRLLQTEDATGAECNRYLDNAHAHKRLSELKRDGLIRETSKRLCAVSGNEAYGWEAVPQAQYVAAEPRPLANDREDFRVGFRQLVYLLQIAQRELDYKAPPELVKLGMKLREEFGEKKSGAKSPR